MVGTDQQLREVPFEEEAEETGEAKRERELDLKQEANEQFGTIEDSERLAEQAELEEIQANELALQRDHEQEDQATNAVQEEGKSFGSPSLIKYFILLVGLAIPNDAIDIILEPTLFGAPLAWFTSVGLSITSILICWFTDQEQKRAHTYLKKIEELRMTLVHTSRNVFRVAKFFRKNPTVKIVVGAILEAFLFIDIIPWSIISVIWAYVDEGKIYRDTGKAAEEVGAISIESPKLV